MPGRRAARGSRELDEPPHDVIERCGGVVGAGLRPAARAALGRPPGCRRGSSPPGESDETRTSSDYLGRLFEVADALTAVQRLDAGRPAMNC
jgi:hypothetical protein